MPKDLIHFKIAERTAARLTDTRWRNAVADRPEALLLGSVFFDTLFYAVSSSGQPLERLAHKLHGADGQDTFRLIRFQADLAARSDDQALPASMLVGLVSHLWADAVMHPMVWHLTGDYYGDDPKLRSEVRQRHRALETLMDMVACPEMLGRAGYRLRSLLRRCPDLLTRGTPVDDMADAAGMAQTDARREIGRAWSLFAWLQFAFPLPWLAGTFHAARPVLPDAAREIGALFYAPQLRKKASLIDGDFSYRQPVTGEARTASLDALMDEAADKTAQTLRKLESPVFDRRGDLLPETGPSMDAGISGVATTDMLHFAQPPIPVLE